MSGYYLFLYSVSLYIYTHTHTMFILYSLRSILDLGHINECSGQSNYISKYMTLLNTWLF